jgi:hypothetical protein
VVTIIASACLCLYIGVQILAVARRREPAESRRHGYKTANALDAPHDTCPWCDESIDADETLCRYCETLFAVLDS